MNIFKRLEVWLLLIAAAGATLFVVWPSGRDKPSISEVKPAQPDSKLTLIGCKLERDFGNARLDIEARLTNRHARKLLLVAPAVRLLNAQGKAVPDYILPAEKPAEVPPNSDAAVVLRYWLEQTDLNGKLTLEVEGEAVEVKSDKPLDLNKLKNSELTKMPSGDWSR
jgi:hypothetical protein